MNKESLEELREIIISGLDKSETMNVIDKTELMLNISKLLEDKETYEESIKVLKMTINKKGNRL